MFDIDRFNYSNKLSAQIRIVIESARHKNEEINI